MLIELLSVTDLIRQVALSSLGMHAILLVIVVDAFPVEVWSGEYAPLVVNSHQL